MGTIKVNTDVELTFEEIFQQLENQEELISEFLIRLSCLENYDFASAVLRLIKTEKLQEYMESQGFNFVDDDQVEF